MDKRLLIFTPNKRAIFSKSAFYVMPMFINMFRLCVQYLMICMSHKPSLAETEDYIKKFWQAQLNDSHTSLWVSGREYLNENETYIYMSNHESWMDIPAIFAAVPSKLRMISKKGIMQIPFLGQAMYQAGFISIDRVNRSQAIKQLEQAKAKLKEGISIWMSPEGRRTRDGSIAPFKKGGFYLAKELNLPIVPVFIEGAALVMPADSVMISTNKSIKVHFLPPISREEIAHQPLSVIMNMVRDLLLKKQIDVRKGV